ncbi:PREDICTED: nitrile-specifier protein 5 [Nelumbo nucifera]|uniref:Nitrile-specifier protein 5 n=1 Tax=Nelumbo nucifera TaxID=4432 RepID=A0A1U7ZW89_NELNU|nr:PREDICTED: nitrile-specifier protein 5 [Nelumbo nucifera]
MVIFQGKWVKLGQKGTGPGARSSHAIVVVGQKAYVFGGEFTPRAPVDNKLHVFDLHDLSWSVVDATGDSPPPRVGVTMVAVGGTIYVFGGRDSDHKELNELYSFDTSTSEWTLLSSGDTGPDHRSYHSMTADDRRVYVFGGCGVAGRLNDLWAFDINDRKWIKFPVPGENCRARGGPGLAVSGGKIWVVYGFSGEELDDVHCFDPISEQWTEVESTGEKPSPRSVFSTVWIGRYIFVYGGEVDPSDKGHLGAGKFASEVYALDTETLVWSRWEDVSDSEEHPGPRGWCAFSAGRRDGCEGLLVYGGNSPSNDRLDGIFFFTPYLDDGDKK